MGIEGEGRHLRDAMGIAAGHIEEGGGGGQGRDAPLQDGEEVAAARG